MKVFLIYAAGWVGMAILAILNGAVREKTYARLMPEPAAHQLSTLIAIVLFGAYIWLLGKIRPLESSGQAVAIGCTWLAMTVSFEFVFGHFVMHHSWDKLLHDYNLFKGRVWLLVLLWTSAAPYLFYRIR